MHMTVLDPVSTRHFENSYAQTHSVELNVIQSVNVIKVFLLNGNMCTRSKLCMQLCL